MKKDSGIRRFMDNIRPHFEKGGKYYWLHSTYDAFDTFFSVPETLTSKGSHIRDCLDLKRLMITVVVALLITLCPLALGGAAAYYGIWALGAWVFILAVYFTSKLM